MRKTTVLLLLLFFASLAIRLFFAFQTSTFSVDAYFAERQVESILETGLPLYNDPLSFQGRTQLFMPLFYYILAGFSAFIPFTIVAKVLPNLFAASIIFFAYLIAKRVTKNTNAALFTAFISAFIPIFFSETIHSISPLTLLLPLLLLQTYCFIRYKKLLPLFLALSFILPLVHYTAIIFPLSLLFLLLLTKIENIKLKQERIELIIFSVTITFWLLLLFFKKVLLEQGPSFFFTGAPFSLLIHQLAALNLVKIVYLLGIIPFIYGVVSTYVFLFKDRSFEGFILLSFVLTPFLLLFTTVLKLQDGLLFLGVFLTIMFSYHYKNLGIFVKKTRLSALRYYWTYFVCSIIIAFLLTAVIPSVFLAETATGQTLHEDEQEALFWIRDHVDQATVFASLEEGDVITSIAKKESFIDSRFLLAPDTDVRYADYQRIKNSPFKTETIGLLNEHNIEYVYLSRLDFKYPERLDEDCFRRIYKEGDIELYRVTCELKTE